MILTLISFSFFIVVDCVSYFECGQIVIGNALEVGHEGSVVAVAVRIGGGRDGGERSAPEVLGGEDDHRLVGGYFLDLVGPLSGELDGRLAGLHARVHGQHLVVVEQLGDVLLELAEHVVVEGARAERELARLRHERLEDARMTVALVDGAVGAQEVEVFVALDVPDEDTLCTLDRHRQRVIVVSAVRVLALEYRLGLGADHALVGYFERRNALLLLR